MFDLIPNVSRDILRQRQTPVKNSRVSARVTQEMGGVTSYRALRSLLRVHCFILTNIGYEVANYFDDLYSFVHLIPCLHSTSTFRTQFEKHAVFKPSSHISAMVGDDISMIAGNKLFCFLRFDRRYNS